MNDVFNEIHVKCIHSREKTKNVNKLRGFQYIKISWVNLLDKVPCHLARPW